MRLIQSGKHAKTAIVPPSCVDWSMVSALEIWSTKYIRSRSLSAPPALDFTWFETLDVCYAIATVFRDGTWVWTQLTVDPDAAVAMVHRLAAENDKPVRRSGMTDDPLRARGY